MGTRAGSSSEQPRSPEPAASGNLSGIPTQTNPQSTVHRLGQGAGKTHRKTGAIPPSLLSWVVGMRLGGFHCLLSASANFPLRPRGAVRVICITTLSCVGKRALPESACRGRACPGAAWQVRDENGLPGQFSTRPWPWWETDRTTAGPVSRPGCGRAGSLQGRGARRLGRSHPHSRTQGRETDFKCRTSGPRTPRCFSH